MSEHIQEHGIVIQSCERCHDAKQVCRALPGFLPGRSRSAKCARCTLSSKPCTATEAIDRIFEQRLLEFSQTQPGPIRDAYLARQRALATAKAREDDKKAAEQEKKLLNAKKLEREQERLEAERNDQREQRAFELERLRLENKHKELEIDALPYQAQIASAGVGREKLLLTGRAVDAGMSVSALTSLLSLVEGHGVAKLTEMGGTYNLRSTTAAESGPAPIVSDWEEVEELPTRKRKASHDLDMPAPKRAGAPTHVVSVVEDSVPALSDSTIDSSDDDVVSPVLNRGTVGFI